MCEGNAFTLYVVTNTVGLRPAAVASQPPKMRNEVSQCVYFSWIRERFLTKNVKEDARSDSKSRCDIQDARYIRRREGYLLVCRLSCI